MRDYILLYINGERHEIRGRQAFLSVTDFLRYEKGLTGTKVVCAEGDCGACTVLRGQWNPQRPEQLNYRSVNACITFIHLVDSTHLITVEGLKDHGNLSPVQTAMVENHGAQCGFCTPGFVCAMTDLFNDNAHQSPKAQPAEYLNEKQIRNALTGNLCRCTGYAPIIQAAKAVKLSEFPSLQARYETPEMLADLTAHRQIPISLRFEDKAFYAPPHYADLIAFKAEHTQARIYSSATDLGVLINKDKIEPTYMTSLNLIPEAYTLEEKNQEIIVGARVSLTDVEKFTQQRIPEFSRLLRIFASPQIKNKGTLVGNIANGSPIGDTLPFLFIANAEIDILGPQGTRSVNINQFYKGYRTLDLASDELISGVRIPLPNPAEIIKLYKVSNRKDLDISTFTAGFALEQSADKIKTIRIAYGGVGPVVLRLPQTEAFLQDKPLSFEVFQAAGEMACQEITPISDVRGSADYRLQLAKNILLKFYYELTEQQVKV